MLVIGRHFLLLSSNLHLSIVDFKQPNLLIPTLSAQVIALLPTEVHLFVLLSKKQAA